MIMTPLISKKKYLYAISHFYTWSIYKFGGLIKE